MPLDIYFTEDIAGTLASTGASMFATAAAHGFANIEYCRGIYDTLRAQALAYRIPWARVQCELRSALADRGLDTLLESAARALVEV